MWIVFWWHFWVVLWVWYEFASNWWRKQWKSSILGFALALIWPHKWTVGLDLGPRITQGERRLAGHLCFFKKDSESCPSSAISCILFGFWLTFLEFRNTMKIGLFKNLNFLVLFSLVCGVCIMNEALILFGIGFVLILRKFVFFWHNLLTNVVSCEFIAT